jgi:hypothetical protein
MKIKTTTAIACVVLFAASADAMAHTYDPDARAADERARIERGRQSGTITYFEGVKLRREQQAIAEREAKLRSDGRLSQSDRRELKARQDVAEDNITAAKANGWHRWSILPRVGR